MVKEDLVEALYLAVRRDDVLLLVGVSVFRLKTTMGLRHFRPV